MVMGTDMAPSGSLQERLDAITANTRALVQPERLARTDQVVEALRATGIAQGVLGPGSEAPAFSLTGANGKKVRLADLVALGPVIVLFFRGRWCPYDMTELEAWQALYPQVREQGALLVAISPQTPRQNAFTVERHGLAFPVLADAGAQVAEAFGLAYTVPEETQRWYRSMLVNVPFLNGDESWRLPLPATAVLAMEAGVPLVRSVVASVDHRTRPEPEAALRALREG